MKAFIRPDVLTAYIIRSNETRAGFAKNGELDARLFARWMRREIAPSARARQKLLALTGFTFDELFEIVSTAEESKSA
jgi:hypothetical protein